MLGQFCQDEIFFLWLRLKRGAFPNPDQKFNEQFIAIFGCHIYFDISEIDRQIFGPKSK